MIPPGEVERLQRELETALGHYNRAQAEIDAAVAVHAQSRLLLAELADTRTRLDLATKAYRDAVFAFIDGE